MAYQDGKTYWIVPQNNTSVALSVYGNTQVSQNRNVILWSKQDIADQLWLVDVDPGQFARIKSSIPDEYGNKYTYALNIWFGSSNYGNCDIHTWADNLQDSKINFRTIDANQNLYLIQNYRNNAEDNNLYLTAESTASGANVKWTGRNTGLNQVWKLIEKPDGGGSGLRTMIDLPNSRTYNWSQFNAAITEICDTAGCSLTCLLDIANIFGPRAYSANEIYQVCGWGEWGIETWGIPASCAGYIDASGYSSSGTRSVYAVARAQINANNPIIIKLSKPGDTHFVVGVGYTGNGASPSELIVLDPGSGRKWTLQEAMNYNYGMTTVQNYILAKRR